MRNEFDMATLKKMIKSKVDVQDLKSSDELNNTRI
jgi:hypothetical protein